MEEAVRRMNAFRVLLTGTVLSAALCWLSLYANMVTKTAYFSMEYCLPGAILFMFLLGGLVNPILKWTDRHRSGIPLAYSPGELAVIFMMLALVSGLVSMGFVENLLPVITGGAYYGDDANRWGEAALSHTPRWMAVTDSFTVRCFYEGLPKHEAAPWRPWLVPLAAWSLFAMAFFASSVALMVIFRKQWVEHERLVFPIAQVPMQMLGDGEGIFPRIMRSRLMWAGALISLAVASINCLHVLNPTIPRIVLDGRLVVVQKALGFNLHFSFVVLGFSYLLSTDVSLSLWLFHVLTKIQGGVFTYLGYKIGKNDPFSAAPAVAHQSSGALLVFVAVGLWVARRHLARVLRCAFGRREKGVAPEDANEIMSYRQAVIVFMLGVAVMAVWLWLSGMNPWTAVVFLLFAFAVIFFLSRAIAQAGMAVARPVLIPQALTVHTLGTAAIGPAGLASLGYSFAWAADVRSSVMASAANGLRAVSGRRVSRGIAQTALWLALVVGLLVSYWTMITICYEHGGGNTQRWFLQGLPKYMCRYTKGLIDDGVRPSTERWVFTGIGGVAMWLLMLARNRLLWWPIHPVGFVVGATSPVAWSWTGICVAWLLKSLVLRYGGVRLFQKTRDMAIGLVIGQFLAGGVWTLISVLIREPGLYVPIL